MTHPLESIDKDRPHHVCHLRKAINGLKQALRASYLELKKHLLNIGFVNLLVDTSLFVYQCTLTYNLVYVDDIIVTGNVSSHFKSVISSLTTHFSIKDPTDLHYFLSTKATCSAQGLHLMQQKYILDLLTKTNMYDAKPVSTPLQTSPKLFPMVWHNLMMPPSTYQ